MSGLGCGCGCSGEEKSAGMGCASEYTDTRPLGVEFEFGLPMAADGVPISSRLPGYEAVSVPSVDGGGLDSFNAFATKPILGCPLWVWGIAAAIVVLERKGR